MWGNSGQKNEFEVYPIVGEVQQQKTHMNNLYEFFSIQVENDPDFCKKCLDMFHTFYVRENKNGIYEKEIFRIVRCQYKLIKDGNVIPAREQWDIVRSCLTVSEMEEFGRYYAERCAEVMKNVEWTDLKKKKD